MIARRGAGQEVRRVHRGGRRQPRRRAGRDPRLPGPQRRRQDHHHPHDRRPAQAHRRPRPRSTATTWPRARGGQGVARLHPRPARSSTRSSPRASSCASTAASTAWTARGRGARIGEMLELFELGRWEHELVESFSHGMKQRLVMCAAFLHRPRAVLVDEPMVGLDPRGARLIKDVFRAHERARRRHPDEHAHARGGPGDVRPHQHHPGAGSSRAARWTSCARWPAARTSSSRRCS